MSVTATSEEIPLRIPELEPHCGSWICTSRHGDVREVFERALAESVLAQGWKVETAAQYLGRFNQSVRL